jgi:hypothetical protein
MSCDFTLSFLEEEQQVTRMRSASLASTFRILADHCDLR